MPTPGWVERSGQPATVTSPPVIAAAARNTAAFDRSGSTVQSRGVIGPGATRHVLTSASSTSTPAVRSIATDMSMCGSDGTGLPSWTTVTPFSYRAPDSSSPETNCDDSEASITTSPPGSAPVAATVNGSRSPSMRAPSALNASSTVPIGRSRARGSPSKRTGRRRARRRAGRSA